MCWNQVTSPVSGAGKDKDGDGHWRVKACRVLGAVAGLGWGSLVSRAGARAAVTEETQRPPGARRCPGAPGPVGPRAGGVWPRAESRLSWGDERAPARPRRPGAALRGEGRARGKPCRREGALAPKMHLPPRDGGRPRNEVGRQAEQAESLEDVQTRPWPGCECVSLV